MINTEVRLTLRLPDKFHQILRKLAFDRNQSINALILEAIKQYLKQNKISL